MERTTPCRVLFCLQSKAQETVKQAGSVGVLKCLCVEVFMCWGVDVFMCLCVYVLGCLCVEVFMC